MKLRPCLLPALLLVVLPGCMGSLLPKTPERAIYAMPEPESMHAKRPLPAALLVELPHAKAPLLGPDIVVVRADGEVQVLPGARWAAPTPQLLQGLIARQIELAGSAPTVAQSAQAYALPLRLSIELHAFELRGEPGALTAQAAVSLRLACAQDARIIAASPALAVDAAPAADTAAAATAALRDAAGALARQVVLWLDQVDASTCKSD